MTKTRNNVMQRNKQEVEQSLANAPLKKKIGFFSAMLVVIGSCIGSGIFFKAGSVLTNSQGSIVFAMFTWIFASFGVLCMALALIDITSARNDNLSVIGWTKTFNSRLVYKTCKNFMFFIYAPLKYFFMPLYCVQAFQDGVAALYINAGQTYNGFGTDADWAIIMCISVGMSVYFIVANGLSARLGNIHSLIISSVKFFPLLFVAVIGFVIFGMNNGNIVGENYGVGFVPTPVDDIVKQYTFNTFSPGFGLFIASIGIFYAFDGFYVAAGIKSELKEPKKTPVVILVGLIVTTIIYLIIAVSMSLGSNGGNPQGLVQWFASHNILIVFAVFEILIGIGIFSVINGFSLWSPRFIEDLILEGELPFSKKFASKIGGDKKKIGILYMLSTSIPTIVILCTIGGLAYINNYDVNGVFFSTGNDLKHVLGNDANLSNIFGSDYDSTTDKIFYHYGTGVGSLYTFCDVVSNWSALFVFLFIIIAIGGGLKNKKTKKVKTANFKYFTPFAILAIIFISSCLLMSLFEPFANLFLLYRIPTTIPNYKDVLISRIMTVVVLFVYIALMFLPTFINDMILKQKYGSYKKGELINVNNIRRQLGLPLAKSYDELEQQEAKGTLGNSLTDEDLHIKIENNNV